MEGRASGIRATELDYWMKMFHPLIQEAFFFIYVRKHVFTPIQTLLEDGWNVFKIPKTRPVTLIYHAPPQDDLNAREPSHISWKRWIELHSEARCKITFKKATFAKLRGKNLGIYIQKVSVSSSGGQPIYTRQFPFTCVVWDHQVNAFETLQTISSVCTIVYWNSNNQNIGHDPSHHPMFHYHSDILSFWAQYGLVFVETHALLTSEHVTRYDRTGCAVKHYKATMLRVILMRK